VQLDGSPLVKEEFLGFTEAVDMSGEALSKKILSNLTQWGLDLRKMRSQGHDGASSMAGKFKGVQAQISADYPLALYVHCACHVLNLALTTASNLPSVRWSMRTIQDIVTFYKGGQKRAAKKKKKKKKLCSIEKCSLGAFSQLQ